MNLSDVANKHTGKTAWIMGAGPSLRHVDASKLNGVTFTVNSSILHHPECDYWVSDDQDTFNWSYIENVQNSSCIKMMDKDRLGRKWGDNEDVVKYRRQHWYDWYDPRTKRYDESKVCFRKSPDYPLAGTRTSTATALHIAWIMGCDPIVLLGCDCCYEDNKRWFWEFGDKHPTRRGKDMYPNVVYGDKDTHCWEMIAFWKEFARVTASRKCQVYNGSGGILDAFPKVVVSNSSD